MNDHSIAHPPVVRVLPLQPHCFAFGGFELQMIGAMEAARSVGTNVNRLDLWARDASFDVLHLWGLSLQHRDTAHWAHLAGKKVLVSALVNYPGWKQSLRYIASYLLGPGRLRKEMLSWVDGVTVVNAQQKTYLAQTLGFPAERIYIVPNIVEDVFFSKNQNTSDFDVGLKDYVICTGNICKRKNQLSLVHACKQIGVPLLIVGDVLLGEESYGKALAEEIGSCSSIRWIKGMPPASDNLASAYKRAAAFALPSFAEQQPISALEAAAARKPLLLGNRPYAKQEFYANAALVDPDAVKSIAKSLRMVLDSPDKYCPPVEVLENCRRVKVGESYASAYEKICVQDIQSQKPLPNLVIVGAPKSGTTSLFKWLSEHPSVVTSKNKETYYLIDSGYPLFKGESNYLEGGLIGYSKLFPAYKSGTLCIEATPDYMYQQTALKVLSELPSRPTIVFILRNPVDRILSLIRFAKNNVGSLDKEVSLQEFLERAKEGGFPDDQILNDALLQSEYHIWIERWIQCCGKSRIVVLFFDDMVKAPYSLMENLCKLCGIDGGFYKHFDFKPVNQSRKIRSVKLLQLRTAIERRYPVLMRISVVKTLYRSLNVKSEALTETYDMDTVNGLYEYFEQPNQKLAKLLGKELPANWSRKC